MTGRLERRSADDRGVSEVVAIALLIGLVVTGAVLVGSVGQRMVSESGTRADTQVALASMQSMDATLTTLAHDGMGDRARLGVGTDQPDRFQVTRTGSIGIAVDGGTCNATLPLTAISYRPRRGATLTYEAGGIWRTDAGGTTMVEPPDVTYRDHAVHVSLMNLSGHLSGSRVGATLLGSSLADTRAVQRSLFDRPSCLRPDNVTIAVQSIRFRAWARYFSSAFGLEIGRGIALDAPNQTAIVHVRQRMLPVAADDHRNGVVDFVDGYGQYRGGVLSVDKGRPSNTYPVSGVLLADARQGGRPTVSTDIDRRPLDVAFVLDESGSMRGEKLAATQAAAVDSIDRMATIRRDRLAVVGYSDTGRCQFFFNPCPPNYPTDARVHVDLTTNRTAVIDSVETDLRADGGTPMAAGLNRTVDLFDEEGRNGSRRVAVLLTDGKQNGDGNLTVAAEAAAAHNVTVFTVGFGDDPDEAALEAIANETGGTYYRAHDASQLVDRFQQIATAVQRTRSIRTAPITLRAGGDTVLQNGSLRPIPPNSSSANLKTPTTTVPIEFSTHLADGERLPIALDYWDCRRWNRSGRSVRSPNGTTYSLAGCSATGRLNGTVDSTSETSRIRAFTAANVTSDLPRGADTWVESNVTSVLRAAGYVDSGGRLHLESNQVVLVYDLPEDGSALDFNDEILLVTMGYSTRDVRARYAIDVTMRDIRLG